MSDDIPHDMSEAFDADIPRLDLVGAAANGTPRFLIAKSDAGPGLFDSGYVRELIAKSEAAPVSRETVTLSGSPAAIAALRRHLATSTSARTPASGPQAGHEAHKQTRKATMPPTTPGRAGGIPAPRPLSARARAFVAQSHADAAGRKQAMEKAAALGVDVAKAAKTQDPVAVYDAAGNLVGIVDPDRITPAVPVQAPGGKPAQAAKAMSQGAQDSGQQQLGGPQPRGGVPTTPAQDAQPEPVTKEQAHQLAANLKKALNGARAGTAAEANRVADAMQQAAITKFQDMQRRGLAPGPPRRP